MIECIEISSPEIKYAIISIDDTNLNVVSNTPSPEAQLHVCTAPTILVSYNSLGQWDFCRRIRYSALILPCFCFSSVAL